VTPATVSVEGGLRPHERRRTDISLQAGLARGGRPRRLPQCGPGLAAERPPLTRDALWAAASPLRQPLLRRQIRKHPERADLSPVAFTGARLLDQVVRPRGVRGGKTAPTFDATTGEAATQNRLRYQASSSWSGCCLTGRRVLASRTTGRALRRAGPSTFLLGPLRRGRR